MSRDPFASSNNDAESALSDDDLDAVVGGRIRVLRTCSHGFTKEHDYSDPSTNTTSRCSGPGPEMS